MKPDYIKNRIIGELGINIFRNTRKREYVDGRALFYYILRTKYNYKYREIVKITKEYGYQISHCTIVYTLKNFDDVTMKYNPNFKQLAEDLLDNETYYRNRNLKYILHNIGLLKPMEISVLKEYIEDKANRRPYVEV